MEQMVELMQSKNWVRLQNETETDYQNRIALLKTDYKNIVTARGVPIMMKKGNLYELHYSKEVDIEAIKEKAIRDGKYQKNPLEFKGEPVRSASGEEMFIYDWWCPYCRNHQYSMRVLDWRYPEGHFDKGGVCMQCVCLKERKRDRSELFSKLKSQKERKKDSGFVVSDKINEAYE